MLDQHPNLLMISELTCNMSRNKSSDEDEDMEMFYSMPPTTRMFPKSIEHLLILRTVMREYKMNGGRITTSDESPESDGEGLGDGRMYSTCIYPPIVGHAVTVNKMLCVCESVYEDVHCSDMMAKIKSTTVSNLKWLITAETGFAMPSAVTNLGSTMMMRASVVYETTGPLSAYNNHAVSEAMNHSMSSLFWQSMYKQLDDVESHYGFYGLIHDNTVISLGDAAGTDIEPDLEQRLPKEEHGGFLDACFTPQSKASGKVRAMVAGCSIRIMTRRTLEIASEMVSGLRFGATVGIKDWIVRCMGFCSMITHKDAKAIVNKWKSFNEVNMPTVHVFEAAKVIVISVATGTIIRPMRMSVISDRFVNQGPYVDSMSVHSSNTMQFADLSFPDSVHEPEQYFNSAVLTIPFAAWTADPRLNLGVQMMRQGLSLSPINGDATIVSHGNTPPLIRTTFLDAVMKQSQSPSSISVPGFHVVLGFINRYLNSEDACSVCKEWAESGALTWSGYINYPLPQDVGHIKVGMRTGDKPWWKPAIDGTVVDVRMAKIGDPYAITHVGSKKLELGDKLVMWHGIKVTVGEIIPLSDMPRIKNEDTGEVIIPNLLLSTKNITRGLGGVIREMAAITNLFPSIESFRTWSGPKPTKVLSFEDQKQIEAKLPNGIMIVNGKELSFIDSNRSRRVVKATYGIARMAQVKHISALKQHYPSTEFNSVVVPRGRYRQGTPRLSEGELLAMIMQNMPSCVRDAVDSADKCIVDQCSGCNRIVINCDCPLPKPASIEVQMRYSLVLLDVFSTVAMLNSPDKAQIALEYLKSP